MSEHRYALLFRTAMEVLAEQTADLHGRGVLEQLERRITLNSAERRVHSSGKEAWDVSVRFDTGDAATAGWLVKRPAGWRITDEGRKALHEFPTPEALFAEKVRRYQAISKQRKAAQAELASSLATIAGLLHDVPAGSWTSYEDLAIAVGREPDAVRHLLAAESFTNSYRVLEVDGGIPEPRFQHVNYRGTDIRARLSVEGVEFDASGHADANERVTAEILLEYVDRTTDETAAEGTRAWLVRGSAVSGYNVVPQWLRDGFASIAASHLRQVEPGTSLDDLRTAVEADYAHLSYAQRKTKLAELHMFLNRMATGDALITTSEGKVYIGRISGGAEWQPGESLTTIRRPVDWHEGGIDFTDLEPTMQTRLRATATVADLTDAAVVVEAMFPEQVPIKPPTVEATLPNPPESVIDQLLVGKEWLQEFVALLRDRRQVILYGPPGTGKTYLALEVASALTDPANVTLVQFHPAYSYEDFFEGYRPTIVDETGRVGFALTPGPFRKVVDQAREDPGRPYILIIDEINRANLAKVFGELYFLLEYRDHSIDLMYASGDEGRDFSLPPNVYLIGTMNTADRSIALVDTAMRRRFAFLSLHPSDEHLANLLRDWLQREGLPMEAADLLDLLNERIPDRDFKIGPSYLMRAEAGSAEGVERIWRTQILPLLEEFHYGDAGVDVSKRYGLPALRAAVAAGKPPPEAFDEGAGQ